jgi:hypothetical protein
MHNVPDYYMLSERVGWRLTDIDLEHLDVDNVSDDDRLKVKETALIENGIPHYTDLWAALEGIGQEWELRQFNLIWSYEEFRHAESLRRLAERLDIDISAQLDTVRNTAFVKNRNASCESGCYETIPGMLMYTILQELITWKFYATWAKVTRSEGLRTLVSNIGADEMRHHQWFANSLPRYFERSRDKAEFRRRVAEALRSFHMPHNFYALHFPFIDDRFSEYFDEDGINQIKLKIGKILSFDLELLGMMMEIGDVKERFQRERL